MSSEAATIGRIRYMEQVSRVLHSTPRTMFDARAARRARDTAVAATSGIGERDIEKVGLYVIGQASTN